MANSLLRDFDSEWTSISTSAWARRSVRSWADLDERLCGFRDLDEMMDTIRWGEQSRSTEICWALLGRVVDGDELATRTLLQAMMPLLASQLRRLLQVAPAAGLDVDQMLVTAANEAIHEMAGKEPKWPIRDIASRTRRLFERIERREERWERLHKLDDGTMPLPQAARPVEETLSATDELAELLREVAEMGSLSDDEVAMVWLTRVNGVSTDVVAKAYGSSPDVFRRRRLRVEARFVEALKAAA